MKNRLKQHNRKKYGSVLAVAVVALMIMSFLGVGMLAIAYGVRHQAIRLKNETAAMLAAEAGYEKAVFWMSQQQDMLTTLYNGSPDTTGTISFIGADCNYSIGFYSFINAQPVYRIISNGHSGIFNRTVDTLVMQAISGWTMGKCRIPSGATTTIPVSFVDGEKIYMPLQINNLNDSPDLIDISISGSPQFKRPVAMGESKGSKYPTSIMNLFPQGIYFDQPDARVTDEESVQSKVDRFKDSTDSTYQFTPTKNSTAGTGLPSASVRLPAVQLEFFVEDGVGKVRITNDCTVVGFQQSQDSRTNDFRIQAGTDGANYERYLIYAYHVRPSEDNRITQQVDQTYVTQSFGGVESASGGQIFVNGNVIIGSGSDSDLPGTKNTVKDKITVVATGNIWVANSTVLDGAHTADANGVPVKTNPNVLGLFAQKVVKVVDPGMSQYAYESTNKYPGPPPTAAWTTAGAVYAPVANHQGTNNYDRVLPNPMVVEAAITSGGGGWGAENVKRTSGSTTYGGRKNGGSSTTSDTLTVRGTLTEAIRGIVGQSPNGYKKDYYLDERLLEGVLPGDIGLQGKFIPAPAGWHDYRN